MWEEKLDDMEAAELQRLDQETLYRRYLGKLPQELKVAVTSRVWPLDGDDQPARKCRTWEDVAAAVDAELETRIDTRCIGNRAGD